MSEKNAQETGEALAVEKKSSGKKIARTISNFFFWIYFILFAGSPLFLFIWIFAMLYKGTHNM